MAARRVVTTIPERLAEVLAVCDDDDVVLAVPPLARVVGDDEAIVVACSQLEFGEGAMGEAVVGRADRLREHYREGGGHTGNVPADDRGVVFHRYVAGGTETVVLDGRVLDAEHGTEPVVVVAASADDLVALDDALADGGARDLVRILSYRDAITPAVSPRIVAPEIVALGFWTPSFCATVVRAAEATGAFGADEDDPVPGHEVSLAVISPRLFAHVEDDVAVRVVPALQEGWPTIEYAGLRDAFVIKYSRAGQQSLRLHHDVAQVSGSVKLNDGYGGGVLEFPRQGFTTAGVAVGELVMWPSLVTHPHETSPLTRGVKYALTLWLEIPGGE